MYHWKYYDNRWHITEKATLTWTEMTAHRKGYDNGWHITKKATLMWIKKITHWKSYDNKWYITEDATITGDLSLERPSWHELKRLLWRIAENATWNSDVRQHVYIKTCPPEIHLHTSLTCYCFASLPHFPFQHVWLCAPRMEPASIVPLSTPSKDDHLFPADHVWKEVLGVSTAWSTWLRRLLYLNFLMWFF
jgi:hypothetical protein